MSGPVMLKELRASLPLLAAVLAGIVTFEVLFVHGLRNFAQVVGENWIRFGQLRFIARFLVGADLADGLSATGAVTLGLAHPLLYALTWAFLLTVSTRLTAAEVERGTAELLLTLPLSRARLFVSSAVVWWTLGAVLSVAPLVGVWLGERWAPLWEPLELGRLAPLCANLYALYLAVGGLALAVSGFVRRRGPAVGIVLAVLLASFLLNFLAQIWTEVERISFLGLLHYYKPLPVVRRGDFPVRDIAVLVGLGCILTLVGLWRFTRRDVPAV